MAYAIAYSDKNGTDFYNRLPWILDDFSSKGEVKETAEGLIFQAMQKLKNLQMKNMVKEIIQLNHHAIKLTFLWR